MRASNKQAKDKLANIVSKLPKVLGFEGEYMDDRNGRFGYVYRKADDTELIFFPEGDGTTRFKCGDGWKTFDRRGIESSFYWEPLYKGHSPKSASEIVHEQLGRIEKAREFAKTAVKVPDVGHSCSPAQKEKLIDQLIRHGSVTFTPSGFGTGYIVQRRKPHQPYGVRKASPELEKFFGVKGLWVSSFDAD